MTGKKIRSLKKEARREMRIAQLLKTISLPEAQSLAQTLERSSSEKLEMAETLTIRARLEDLSVYKVTFERKVRKGTFRTYTYWYASWRTSTKVRNVYLGSTKQLTHNDALAKARKLKAESLGMSDV
jgi:hypothetical protein